MNSFPNPAFTSGKYLITPMSRPLAQGRFQSSVSIRSGHGSGTHDRVYRFTPDFSSHDGALEHAAQQGREWLRAQGSAPVVASTL